LYEPKHVIIERSTKNKYILSIVANEGFYLRFDSTCNRMHDPVIKIGEKDGRTPLTHTFTEQHVAVQLVEAPWLQARRSWIRFTIRSLGFSIELTFPAALWR
jgi:hypothetical protein